MDFFNSHVHAWYARNKRDLPWRNTNDAYAIWLSEIILQQTRVDQGLAYFLKFMREFPSLNDLADASEDRVLKLWQGLGYYSRARNLHSSAQYIKANHQGAFPNRYHDIRSLKGIGDYTAAAIASIAFGLEYPAVDGNVYRLLSRYFGIDEPIDSSGGKAKFGDLAKKLIAGTDPGMHNQAVMEFGALQCTPRNPDCTECPLQSRCVAFAFGKIAELPFKQGKTRQRDRYFNYLVIQNNEFTWLRKRSGNDIWKNLFEFPLIENEKKTEIQELLASPQFGGMAASSGILIEDCSTWKTHQLSHQKIHYRLVKMKAPEDFGLSGDFIRVNKKDIFNFAVPKLLEHAVDELQISSAH